MKTLRELKKIFIGEFIAMVMILPFTAITNGDFGISFMDFVEMYIMDAENTLVTLGFGVFTIMMTYVIYVLYKAIERDVSEIIDHFRNKKKTTN